MTDDAGPNADRSDEGADAPVTRRYARYVLFMTAVVTMLNVLDRSILSILLEEIRIDLGASDRAMGFLAGLAFSIVHVAAAIPIARWADRGVRRSIIALGVLVWSAATAACGLATHYLHLLAARSVVGVSEAAGGPPSNSLLADYFPPERRALAMAMNSVGATIGIAGGLVIGGLVATAYGWRMAFVVAGLPGVLFALLYWSTVREPVRGALEPTLDVTPIESTREGIAILLQRRSFVFLVLSAGFHNLVIFSFSVWTPTFLIRVHGMDMASAGLTLVLAGPAMSSLGAYLGGRATDRLAKRDVRWTMYIPAIGAFLAIPWLAIFVLAPASWTLSLGSSTLPVAILFYAGGSAFAGVYAGATWAMGQTLAPVPVRALGAAVLTISANLIGQGIGPFSVGWVSTALAASAVGAGALSSGSVGAAPMSSAEALQYALLLPVCALAVAGSLNLAASRYLHRDLGAKHL